LAVQPAEVGTNRCAGVSATARSGVRKIRWCLHLVAENGHFEPPKSHCRARWNISPETTRRSCDLSAFMRWLLPPWSAFVLFKRERGGGWGEDLATLVWRSGLDSASEIARRCQVARSKAGTSEVYVFRGLSRVGTTPIRSGSCRRHVFLKIAKAGAEVPGPCTGCCRTKPRNSVATIALVDRSRTVLTSWSSSCATTASSSCN
jgi:hypothetical protein